MPEYTLEDIRRIYMITSLFPKQTWGWKKVCFDLSARDYGKEWATPHIRVDPPSSIPSVQNLPVAQVQQDSSSSIPNGLLEHGGRNGSTAQGPALLGMQGQQSQYSASVSEHRGSYVGQDHVRQNVPPAEHLTSYVDRGLFTGQDQQCQQGQQDQQTASVTGLPANYIYSQHPIHSAPTTSGWSFAGTAHGNTHFPNASDGWIMSHESDVSIPAGQHSLEIASYSSAGSSANTFVAVNPNFAFTPQTARSQTIEPRFLRQVPDENLADHDMDVEGNVSDVGSNEGDSDTTFEEDG